MAKTKTTASERSITDCFIEIRGNASFKSSKGTNNIDDKGVGNFAVQNVNVTSSTTENNICESSEIREENLKDTDDSNSGEIVGHDKPGDKENEDALEVDDKSDYEAESFCSDDSCKGSEVTNVTPRSSLSGCSSLLHSAGLKYDKRLTDLIRSRKSGDSRRDEDEDGDGLSLLESEMKYLSEEERTMMIDRRQLTRSGRRNMSFTNEELRKIERENQLLLRKIMSHQKPQNKTVKPSSGLPRTSSSAINRKRQQKKIEEDNMILLRRIQQAKPCAMPRASAPTCRLMMM